jgi:hypothetical protein
MDVMALRSILMLLLLFAPLDDVWASATPDPSDDAIAAQNNEFQHTVCWQKQQRSNVKHLPVPGQAAREAAALSATAVISAELGELLPKTPVGPSLIYALMSLQR